MVLFFRRIYAMILRHIYLFMCSWPRVLELIYWPFLNMVLWAFMSKFLSENSNIFLIASGVLIASIIMWDTLFRGQLGVTLSFIEELWSRNLGNIAVSPLKPIELILSLIVASFLRTLVGVGGAGIAAYFLFDFNMPLSAFGFVMFFINLLANILLDGIHARIHRDRLPRLFASVAKGILTHGHRNSVQHRGVMVKARVYCIKNMVKSA